MREPNAASSETPNVQHRLFDFPAQTPVAVSRKEMSSIAKSLKGISVNTRLSGVERTYMEVSIASEVFLTGKLAARNEA